MNSIYNIVWGATAYLK